jgi:hypothetical protein
MKEEAAVSHCSWGVPHKKERAIDKKGLAVAVAFLVVIISLLAGGREDKTTDHDRQQEPPEQEHPVLSGHVDIRPWATASFQTPASVRVPPLADLRHDVGDSRRR